MQLGEIKLSDKNMILILILIIVSINPFHKAIYGLIILSVYILIQALNIKVMNAIINIQFLILLFFCLSYSSLNLSYQFININTFIDYSTYPLILYIFGIVIVLRMRDLKRVFYYLYSIILGFALVGISSVFYTLLRYGTLGSANFRVGLNPWFGDAELSATGIGIYVSLGIGLAGLLFVKTNLYLKALNALIFSLSLYTSLAFANRTGLIITILSVILLSFTQIGLNPAKKSLKSIFLLCIQCLVLITLFNMNVFNLKLLWLQSNAYERFYGMNLGNDPRYIVWAEAFKGVFANPLGGRETQLNLIYAHNLWLDVGLTTGLFPTVLIFGFTLMTLNDYIKMLRYDDLSLYFKYLITTMLCAFFITFMVEPVIQANILYFCAFCFVSGVIRSINMRVTSPF